MKDGFSERTALRWCSLFPKLQVQRQPPATGCVCWDLAQFSCVEVFPVPIRDLVIFPLTSVSNYHAISQLEMLLITSLPLEGFNSEKSSQNDLNRALLVVTADHALPH